MDAQEIATTAGVTIDVAERIVAARYFGSAFVEWPLASANCSEQLFEIPRARDRSPTEAGPNGSRLAMSAEQRKYLFRLAYAVVPSKDLAL